MLNQNHQKDAVASNPIHLNSAPLPQDKKARERLAARRRMAARRAIERHFERREIEMHSKEYWFDG